MARLLAAQRRARLEHPLEHVAVADVGHLDRDPVLAHQAVEAQVRHRRDDDPLAHERVAPVPLDRERRDDGVAVHGPAASVDREAAIGVAVEREAAVRLGAPRRPRPRRRGASSRRRSLMFRPSGSAPMNRASRCTPSASRRAAAAAAPFAQSNTTRRSPCTPVAVRLEQPVGVALDGVLDRLDAAAARARGAEPIAASTSASAASGSLRPSAPRNLMPLSAYGLCEAEMTQPRSAPSCPTRIGDAGSRDDPGRERGASAGDDALDEGGLERRARLARVAAQHDPAPRAGDGGRRRPQLAGEVLGQIDAGDPPHAVCPEQLAERCQRLGISASRTAAACGPSSGRPSCARPGGRRGSGTPASSGRCAGSRRPR